MESLSFFGRIVQLILKLVFSDSFVNITTQLSDGSHYVANNTQLLHKTLRKSLFISAETYEKYIVCKDYCIAYHNDKTCFLPSCKNHILLLRILEELLKKLDRFCFTYQHVDCLYTLFKYRISGKVIAKRGQVFDNVQRAVDFNQRNTEVDRMPSIAQKRLLRKKYKIICSAPFKRPNRRKLVDQCLQKELKKLKRLNVI